MRITWIRQTAAIAAAVAVIGGLPACSSKSETELIASAKRHLEKNDQKAAIIELKSALQKSPESAEARALLGKALLKTGAYPLAVVELEKARDLRYSEVEIAPPLAKALLGAGQGKKVVERYADTALADPLAASELKTTLAMAYQESGARDRSEQAVDAALQLNPHNAAALLHKARLAGLRRSVDEALALIAQALKEDPKNPRGLLLRGDLLLGSRQDVEGARQSFRDALAIDDKYIDAHIALISLEQRRNDDAAFRAQVQALKKVAPAAFPTRYYEAQIALADGDLKAARERTQELMRAAPGNPQLLLLAGTVELRSGAYTVAETHLGKLLQITPESTTARRTLAQTYLRMGQGAKALPVLAPLLQAQQPDAEALTLAAEAHLQAGDKPAADALFAQALKANPNDPKLRSALALSQISKGDVDAGFKQLQALAAKDPGIASDVALIQARLRRNDLPSALEAIERLQAKAPTRSLPHYLRARVLLQQNDAAGARAAFEKALALDPKHFATVAGLASLDFAQNKPEEARKRFEALLERDPSNPRALLAVADLRQRAGAAPADVGALLVDAVKRNPGDAQLRLRLIGHHLASQNVKAALTAAQDAAAALPSDMRVLDALAEAQMAAGETQQAITTFNKAVTAQPRRPEPLVRLAHAHARINDNAGAVKALRRALEVSRDHLPAQQGLVQIALTEKRWGDAAAVARSVQQQRPTAAVGYVLESEIHARQKQWDLAVAAGRAALERSKTSDMAARLYVLHKAAGQDAQAERFAADWERSRPDDADFQHELGTIALGSKNYPEAEARFRKTLTLRPSDAIALNNVAWLMVQQRKPGALQFAQRAQALQPDSVTVMDTMASALAAEQKLTDAIAWQRKAIEKAPDAAYYRFKLAKLLAASGDKAAARAELEALSKLGTRFPGQAEVAELLKTL